MVEEGAQELRGHGLSPAQYQVLALVHRRPGLHQRGITEALGVTKGNVSQLLTRLEESDLLVRSAEGSTKQIVLTARGERLVAELIPAHRAFLARSFAALTPQELDAFAQTISRLTERPAEVSGPPPTRGARDERANPIQGAS